MDYLIHMQRICEGDIIKPVSAVDHIGNAIKLGVRGFVRICIEICARGCFVTTLVSYHHQVLGTIEFL